MYRTTLFYLHLGNLTISGVHKWDIFVENSSWFVSGKITTFYNQIGILNDSLCWKINKSRVKFL